MKVIVQALNILLPPRCIACNGAVEETGSLCPECWKHITFIGTFACERCHAPFGYEVEEGALCGACMAEAPPYRKARAVLCYDDGSRPLITAFKYSDKLHATPRFAAWMAQAGKRLLEEADLLIPVPLHPFRLFTRRYNQAALLAQALGKLTGKTVMPQALKRIRYTPPQASLSRHERLENVRGCFAVHPRYVGALKGKQVLLIDDVITTGATVDACTKALRKAGVKEVDVLVIARTIERG